MVKSILKELCIIILLCIATVLVFGIAFYDFVPISKIVPNKVAYTVPQEIQNELNEDVTVQEIKPQQITYSVTSSDLKQYQSATVYQPGNPNPFQAYSTGNGNSTIINNSTGNTTTGGSAGSSNNGIQYYYSNSSLK